jgi:hypothetical protein
MNHRKHTDVRLMVSFRIRPVFGGQPKVLVDFRIFFNFLPEIFTGTTSYPTSSLSKAKYRAGPESLTRKLKL